MSDFEEHGKKVARFMAQTWNDAGLKGRLKKDPAGTLREHGFDIPDGVEIRLVEDGPKVRHVVLPHPPSTPVSHDDPGIEPQATIPGI